ncbi:MAG: cupin 2 protein [Actinomycetia bacterium]|nr:cupin 2 protein [Actinomycetes bacterium]
MILGPGDGRSLTLGTQALRILSEGTGVHDVAIVDTVLPPGSGSGRHVHHGHEEAFFVIEGTVRLEVDGREVDAGPGGFALAQRGQVHAFSNESDTDARMLAVYAPASAVGYLDELAEIVRSDGTVDAGELAAFYERFDSAAG